MAQVGDRVEIKAKTGTRFGVVISVSGSLLRLRWDTGEESTLVPAPGVLRVVSAKKRAAPAKARSKRVVPAGAAAAGKSNPIKKVTPDRPTPIAGRRAVEKKIAAVSRGAKPRKKPAQRSEPDLSAAEPTDQKEKKSKKGKKKKR